MGLKRRGNTLFEVEVVADRCASTETSGTSLVERYSWAASGEQIVRALKCRNGAFSTSTIPIDGDLRRAIAAENMGAAFDQSFLRSSRTPILVGSKRQRRLVDLFAGCGFMTLGLVEAGRACGVRVKPVLAVDVVKSAIQAYELNFRPESSLVSDVCELFPGDLRDGLDRAERSLVNKLGTVDTLIGGPPCQGHSNLNNFTRGRDPKNELYLRMARAAQVLGVEHLIIENVASVLNDSGRVVERTVDWLLSLGYRVDHGILDLSLFGVAQRRRRHVLVASMSKDVKLGDLPALYGTAERPVSWALSDLLDRDSDGDLDRCSVLSGTARKRIDYLFDHDVHDLPDRLRPSCHRDKPHRYQAVYGRLWWDEPSRTITSGFSCMGQGRFVHPKRRRTLTPHEAARLQFIPDFYRFPADINRTALAEMIGNGVPPKLSYVIGCELFR